ncbi:uncharacterized protein EAF02_004127 [Botrytis sinoallii]|uniref:uncharacterized protein n=1 Tax=Botrytis sinoallii TaxID=1463999 RepID=UPI0018FF345D|nr:uncharacterized protein EAF02_004127 [Botrytis sinoallii]KAF7885618.1 hypothetical protein EAF02_004127 [Botrytis sinoallii]
MRIPNSLYTCAFCCKFNLLIKHCGSCLSILYCSRECQRLDWSFHKGFCKAFTSLGPRPSDGHSLAFYFPVDLDPRLEWVRRPDFLHPKANNRILGFRSLGFMESKPTSPWPYILCRGGCRDDNLKLNHSVISFTRGAYWTGPLVVFRTGRPDIDSEVIRDILLDDLPRVIRWLRQISNGSRVMKPQVFKSSFNTSKCVILRCRGDYMNAPEETQLVVSKVPELHPIFEGQPTNLSQLMGIPLIIQKIPREAGRDVAFDKDYLRNYYCGILHFDTRPHKCGDCSGRETDKKDITTLQLLAIMTFIKLLDLREVEDELDVKTKQRFLEGYFTRMKFEQFFFGRFAAASDQVPHLDGDLISPYSNSYDSTDISQNSSLVDRALDLWHRTGLRAIYLVDD